MKTSKEITKQDFIELMEQFNPNKWSGSTQMDFSTLMITLELEEKGIETKISPLPEEARKLVEDSFIYGIFTKRIEYLGINVTRNAKLVIASLLQSPGESTIMSAYLYYRYGKDNEVNMTEVGKLFGWNYPTSEDFKVLWDNQKVIPDKYGNDPVRILYSSDNMLDYKICYE